MTLLTGQEVSGDVMENRLKFVEASSFDFLYVCYEKDAVLGVLGFRIRENLEEASKYARCPSSRGRSFFDGFR